MTQPTNPNQAPKTNRPRPDTYTIVLLTFDYMQDALQRRDGDAFVNCIESLRHHLGGDVVDAMVAYFIKVGLRRMAQQTAGRGDSAIRED
jgi:hypothetical protein